VGFVLSLVFFESGAGEVETLLTFSDNIFFYVCLPPIIFASGFNLQTKNFFSNVKNMIIFGIFGTLICFLSSSFLTYLYVN
jgi:NhaP-type Na+/H+ or K+/H+ antiporter